VVSFYFFFEAAMRVFVKLPGIMILLTIDIKWLLLILLTINLSIFFTIKPDKGFLICIPFWVILLTSFFLLKNINDDRIERQEKDYYNNMGDKSYGDFELWQNLEKQKFQARQINMALFRLLGVQTILTFIIQIFAYRKTKAKTLFWWTRTSFGLLTLVYLTFELLLGIVPTGPLI
jgi:hypothetical protein